MINASSLLMVGLGSTVTRTCKQILAQENHIIEPVLYRSIHVSLSGPGLGTTRAKLLSATRSVQ